MSRREEREGGQAFPGVRNEYGMTLRDYFATEAMAEILARWGSHQAVSHAAIAALAYSMAEAMLVERSK